MANTIQLMKQRVLDMAIKGELVEQRSGEGNAKDLLSEIEVQKIKMNDVPYDIPETWTWVKIEDIGQTKGGNGFPKIMQKKHSGKYAFFKVGDLSKVEGNYALNSEFYLDDEDLNLKNFYVFPQTTVVFPKIGAALLLNNRKILNQPSIIDNNCMGITPNEKVSPEYLFYFLKTVDMGEFSQGTSVPSVNQKHVNNIDFPLPPLSEQKRVVSKIEEIFMLIDKIAERKEDALQTIQLIRQTTLQQAIQGKLVEQNEQDEPASKLLARIEEEKAELIEQKKIKRRRKLPGIKKEEIEFNIPKSWGWARLGEISSFSAHQSVKSSDLVKENILIELEDIESNSGRILQEKTVEERQSKSNKYVVHEGNVLYGKLRPYLNKVTVSEVDGYCSTEIFPIHFYGNISSTYMMYVLRSPYFVSFADRNSQGTKMPRLGSSIGRNALIPIPPLLEQEQIVSKIDAIMENCDQIEELFK